MKGYSNLYHAINDLKSGDKEQQFSVLCSHSNTGFVGFESADFHEIEPRCNDTQFLDYCEEMIKKYKVNVIFASNRQVALEKNKARFKALGAEIVTAASHRVIPSINNKAKLYRLLEGGPVKIPQYAVFNDLVSFNENYKLLKKQNSKLCMKPTEGVYGLGFYVLKDKSDDLKSFLKQEQNVSVHQFRKNIGQSKFKQMVLMQFLEGAERSVDCVAFHGQLIGGTIRKKNPAGLPQVIEVNEDLMAQVKWIVEKLKLSGMFNVQFKDFNGIPYLLEINPRLSGRSFYSTIAGFNIPLVASQLFSGLKEPKEIKYETQENLYISALNCPVIASKYKEHLPQCLNHKESK